MEVDGRRVDCFLVGGVNGEATPILDQPTARQGHVACRQYASMVHITNSYQIQCTCTCTCSFPTKKLSLGKFHMNVHIHVHNVHEY